MLLAVVLPLVDVDWTPGRVYLLMVTPLVGGAIYGAMFALAGGVQFWLIDGAEFTTSFVYGGALRGPGAGQRAARRRCGCSSPSSSRPRWPATCPPC